MIRKLASIQKISSVESIKNSDNLEKVKVLGWEVVVKKGEFKPDQLCIYCEIDSVLPEKPEFEFLKDRKFRIKTIKLRGTLSQGIVFPLEILPDNDRISILERYYIYNNENIIGHDLTQKLGIYKYEIPVSPGQKGNIKGEFPTYLIPKTDEQRIQSEPGLLNEIYNLELANEVNNLSYYITEKIDGTSLTVIHIINEFKEHEIKVCSRNLELKPGDDVYWKITRQYFLEEKLKAYYKTHNKNIAIQGEICGLSINKNPLNLSNQQFFVFNIYDIDNHKYYDFENFINISKELELQTVPIIETGRNFKYTLEELLKKAKGVYLNTNNQREGIVIRPTKETYSNILQGRLSFKVINNDYLLKEK